MDTSELASRRRALLASSAAPRRPVKSELARIRGLPRRPPPTDEGSFLTRSLRTAEGKMTLRPAQAAALWDALLTGGLVANLRVGGGKTLTAALLPTLWNSEKAAILVPSGLKAQLLQHRIPALVQHWKIRPHYDFKGGSINRRGAYVISHSELSDRRYARILDVLKPDCVVVDEAHAITGDSARTRRFERFADAHPDTRFAFLTGTAFNRSCMDAAPLGRMALRGNSPWPVSAQTRLAWAERLDARGGGVVPGLGDRAAFRRLVEETPGFVSSPADSLGVSLRLGAFRPALPDVLKRALKRLRTEWTLPDGTEFSEPSDFARHAATLALGFYYVWDWPEGRVDHEWNEARLAWNRAVRGYLTRRSVPGLDSPGLLTEAAERGEWTPREWAAWSAVRDRRPPPTRAVWLADDVLHEIVEWGRKEPGIIWTSHRAVGPKVAELGGYDFYRDSSTQDPENEATGERTIVASLDAFGTGQNLQMFNRMLFTSVSSSQVVNEQGIGRCHRPGQCKNTVYVDYALHTPENKQALENATRTARTISESTPGADDHKLLIADRSF